MLVIHLSVPSIRKGTLVKRIFRSPVLAGAIVIAAVLAALTPASSGCAYAQAIAYRYHQRGYYNPYGLGGPYGGYGYGRSYTSFRAVGSSVYGYSGYETFPSGYGYQYGYGAGPRVRVYGRSSYYQPSYSRVYSPFRY
jgi:hypothetical protein